MTAVSTADRAASCWRVTWERREFLTAESRKAMRPVYEWRPVVETYSTSAEAWARSRALLIRSDVRAIRVKEVRDGAANG